MLGYSDGTAWLESECRQFRFADTSIQLSIPVSTLQVVFEGIVAKKLKSSVSRDSVEEQKNYINGIGASNR